MRQLPIRALLRGIPDSFAGALSAAPPEEPIDVPRARAQHAAYRAALEASGAAVTELPADERLPDCVFVEDTAVVSGRPGEAGGLALITRPGAPSRRGETDAVAAALGRHLELARVEEPATLDGGDCMRLGATLYIGRSARTNAAGIARAEAVLAPRGLRIVAVELPPGVLHLKCVCSPLGDGRVLLAEGTLPPGLFDAAIVWVPAEERYAANAVAIGADGSDGADVTHVIAAAEYPRTLEALAAAGLRVHPVPTSEVRKADGSLTCQSILF
jgi:dimethylargininase